MNIESHIENATRAIHNAKIVRNTSKKILSKKSNIPQHIFILIHQPNLR
jgi:hypothetical protein